MFEALPDVVAIIDWEGIIIDMKGAGRNGLLNCHEPVEGRKIHQVFDSDTADRLMADISHTLKKQQSRLETYCFDKGNQCQYYIVQLIPVDLKQAVINFRDITEYKLKEIALAENEQRWKYALEGNGTGVWDWDIQKGHVFYSQQLKKITGITSDTDKTLFETDEFWQAIEDDDRRMVSENIAAVIENQSEHLDFECRMNKCESVKWVRVSGRMIVGEQPIVRRIVGTLTDITERKKTEADNQHLHFHDKLTGLYNRAYFEEELKRLDTERQLPVTVIIGDVNGLKLTNDIFGHLEGDQLLKEISRILEESCRKEDVVARWGGDEFAIILPKTTSGKANEICRRIHERCEEAEHDFIQMSIALGAATKSTMETEMHELIKEAENRMYRNKLENNKNNKGYMLSFLEEMMYKKTEETREHADRIRRMGIRLAEQSKERADFIDFSLLGTFHDVGTIAIKDSILMKRETLTAEDWEEIRKHPDTGYRIAESIHEISHIADYILAHHEHWDGNGYPQGLKGEEIPKASRMLAIIDAYDVMTHPKDYKAPMSHNDAIAEIRRCAGTQFDPELVNLFISFIMEEITTDSMVVNLHSY
jgi:diguanylate cyclase (GGDEF)-like protein/PAS domain S-box-containing protein